MGAGMTRMTLIQQVAALRSMLEAVQKHRYHEPDSDARQYCNGCGRSPYATPPHDANCLVPRIAKLLRETSSTKAKTFVTVQVEAWLPRTLATKNGTQRKTKKLFRTWASLGSWPVLYAGREGILVRQFGSLSIYHSDGSMSMAGFNRDHPAAKRVPAKHGSWRLEPESVKHLGIGRRS